MTRADRERGDRLNAHLDALVAGEPPRDLDPATTEAVRRFFADDDAPAPPGDLANQIWKTLMNQTAPAGTIPLGPPAVVPPAPNGRTQSHPWHPRRWPEAALPRPHHLGLVGFATAALLLVTLSLGYVAFGPLRPGPDQPLLLPAVVAPEATPGTPVATPAPPFPRTDHSIIGVWQWDYDPCAPGTNTSYAIFHADGTYIEYQTIPGVSIGTWRATGEQTVELVEIARAPAVLQAVSEPGFVLPESVLTGPSVTAFQSIELDETGNALTATGYYEPRDERGAVIIHLEFSDECNGQLVATRVSPPPTVTPPA